MHDGESHQSNFDIEPFLCRRTENIFRLLFHIFEVDSIYSMLIQYIRAFPEPYPMVCFPEFCECARKAKMMSEL